MTKQKITTMFVSPVQRKSVQGRSEYSYIKPDGTIISSGRSFAKNVAKRYNFPSDASGSMLRTGLERQVDNPWYKVDVDSPNEGLPEHYHVGAEWRDELKELVKKPQITKQLELEVRFNLPKGHLTNRKNFTIRLRDRRPNDKPSFLEVFTMTLYDRPNRFDDTTLRSALCMELCKVSGKIAEDKAHSNPSKHDFYVSDENEAAIERAAKQDVINDAITDLTLLRRKQTPFLRYQVATILGKVTGQVSEVVVKDSLNEFVSSKTKTQLQNIEKFNKLVDLVNGGKDGLKKLWIMYVIKQALNTNVMSIRSGQYLWHSKKGIDNLYDLGTNYGKILQMFQAEYSKYGLSDDAGENWYKDLHDELLSKGVKLEE